MELPTKVGPNTGGSPPQGSRYEENEAEGVNTSTTATTTPLLPGLTFLLKFVQLFYTQIIKCTQKFSACF